MTTPEEVVLVPLLVAELGWTLGFVLDTGAEVVLDGLTEVGGSWALDDVEAD